MKTYLNKIWLIGILPVLIGLLVNWLTPIDIPKIILIALKCIGSFLLTNMVLPIWAIIILVLILPTLIFISFALSRKRVDIDNSYLQYVADTFFGIEWYWQYVSGRLYDHNIIPRCPHCKSALQPVEESAYVAVDDITLLCHHCGFKQRFGFNLSVLLDRVKREIDRKVVTGEYKKTLYSN